MAHAVVIVLLAVASVFGLYVVVSMLYCTMAECARCVLLLYSIATPSAARGEQAGYAAHNNNNQHHDAAASTRLSVDSKEETRLRVSDAEHTDTCCICLVTPRPTHDTTRHASSSTTTALQVTSGKKLEKTKNRTNSNMATTSTCCAAGMRSTKDALRSGSATRNNKQIVRSVGV